jgi:hypothetical protein
VANLLRRLSLVGAALYWLLAGTASAAPRINSADNPHLSAIGVDLPGATANQPASIGNFTGSVGFAHFAGGARANFQKFDFDLRFQQGSVITNSGRALAGQWAFT